MHIIDTESISVLTELLFEELPKSVLNVSARFPRSSEAAIVTRILDQFPARVETNEIRERCISSLRWFVHHGDIASTGSHRYTAVPPYIVIGSPNQNEIALQLFGDPRLDIVVSSVARKLGGYFHARTVPWKWAEDSNSQSIEVGYTRTVVVPESKLGEAKTRFVNRGILPLDLADLTQSLPAIVTLTAPSADIFTIRPPNWGFWDIYNSQLLQFNRWQPVRSWEEVSFGILRWRSSLDWRGEQSTRYFYHKGVEKLAELGDTAVKLWMLYQDRDADNCRSVWFHMQTLWVPSILPNPHYQWLQLVSFDWYRQEEYHIKFHLRNEVDLVVSHLRDTLGVRAVSSLPPF